MKARLALADGLVLTGEAFGARGERTGEAVFNTSLFGYQEILTDPSYAGQLLCMTNPEIGNVGVNSEDEESDRVHPLGLIVRSITATPSSWRSRGDLPSYLERHGVVGVAGVDTRRLVRHLRSAGAQMGVVSTEDVSDAALIDRARQAPGMEGQDLASRLSCTEPYAFTAGMGDPLQLGRAPAPPGVPLHVVAFDFGLKRSMLRLLVDAGCRVTVVPAHTAAPRVLALRPDGVFLTNGPGDPAAVVGVDRQIAALLGKVPICGICMGHQLLARALGAKTFKLKFGHRGANQPVQEVATGRVEITAQNHGFAVDSDTLPSGVRVTHRNLNDGTVEGIESSALRAFSVQHHPEASPGPHDARSLYGRFLEAMRSTARGPAAY
jgi:carbamoyl-phosphate synthase small subunit